MKTIIIPLTKSKIDYLDLKYCLRSIEKFVTGYDKIVIIGERPKGIKNVIFIPFSETLSEMHKERNILDKIKYACEIEDVSDDFCFWNDDFIVLEPTDITDYPFYHKGDLENATDSKSMYRHTMRHTLDYLKLSIGGKLSGSHVVVPLTLNYDTHCPIIYNKQKFLSTFEGIDFDIPFGYGIKSMYANLNNVEGEYMPDCKFTGKNTKEEVKQRCMGRHIISCNETSLRHGLGEYLKEILPHKSTFE